MGVVGPSGVGKTTILKLITGIVAPDEGAVRVAEGAVGYVFQEPRLLPWRTALDNVAAPLRAQGMEQGRGPRAGRARGWRGWAWRGSSTTIPAELSGGMAQRVSVARALAVEPAHPAHGRALQQHGRDPQGARLMVILQEHPQGADDHRRLRHPRPDRGPPAGRPHRGADARPDACASST